MSIVMLVCTFPPLAWHMRGWRVYLEVAHERNDPPSSAEYGAWVAAVTKHNVVRRQLGHDGCGPSEGHLHVVAAAPRSQAPTRARSHRHLVRPLECPLHDLPPFLHPVLLFVADAPLVPPPLRQTASAGPVPILLWAHQFLLQNHVHLQAQRRRHLQGYSDAATWISPTPTRLTMNSLVLLVHLFQLQPQLSILFLRFLATLAGSTPKMQAFRPPSPACAVKKSHPT